MRSALLLTLFVSACGGGVITDSAVPEGPCEEGPVTVTAGVGEVQLQLLTGGETVQMVHGPQGGWHVDTAALIGGSGEVVQIIPAINLTESGLSIAGIEQVPQTVALAAYDDTVCEGNIIKIRALIDDVDHPVPYSNYICSLDGKEVELTQTVTDVVTGNIGTGTARFILRIDPADSELCSM